MKNSNKSKNVEFNFPVGYIEFSKNKTLNFQFNRFYSFGFAEYNDLMEMGKVVKTVQDWKEQFLKYAKIHETKKNILQAAYYYRAAEFYMPFTDEKMGIYDKFQSMIHPIMKEDGVVFDLVPYNGSFLPSIKMHTTKNKIGDLVIHGGFDSYKEEFYSVMKYFVERGYDVYIFEGPGQGEANRKYQVPMHHHWEKPTSAVLDFYNLDDVTLLGISMGGYLCFRAAAFDKRIKRLIASSVAYDYNDLPPKLLQPIVKLFYTKFKKFTANAILKQIEKQDLASWYFTNLQYMLKKDDPIEMVNFLTSMDAKELHCENVTQDVLILTGKDDHACPFKMHKKQIDALINAKSVSDKVYYKDSNASAHCQIGNIKLSLDDMADWMDSKHL